MTKLSTSIVLVVALMGLSPASPASAVTYDKLAYMTFTGPVQVPGAVLGAGTYRFRLANPDTSRNVLQVLSRDGSTVYAMFHTIPDHRMEVTEHPTVSFRETPAGVPPAVKTLFYGGEHRGYEFFYGEGPVMTAEVRPQPEVIFTPNPVAEAEPEPTVQPWEPVVEHPAEPVVEYAAEPVAEAAAQTPAELPRTASPLPLLAVGGLTSLLAGLGLGLARRRTS